MSSTRTDLGARVLTYAELLAREGDEEVRRELLEGELHLTPSPLTRHQLIVRNLSFVVHAHVAAGRLGQTLFAPMDVVLDEHNVLQPDILFVSTRRLGIMNAKNIGGAPDLVVEVLSPSNRRHDVAVKLTIYQRFGVSHYWIVDPEDRVLEELVLTPAGYQVRAAPTGDVPFTPGIFPDLTIDLSTIWA